MNKAVVVLKNSQSSESAIFRELHAKDCYQIVLVKCAHNGRFLWEFNYKYIHEILLRGNQGNLWKIC